MTAAELDRLVATGVLQKEPPATDEIEGLMASAAARLTDAQRTANSLAGRFDLAYNAAHALAVAALRHHGYRAQNRYVVFQALGSTLGIEAATWRVLDRCHRARNEAEYQGVSHVNDRLVQDLIAAALTVQEALRARIRKAGRGR